MWNIAPQSTYSGYFQKLGEPTGVSRRWFCKYCSDGFRKRLALIHLTRQMVVECGGRNWEATMSTATIPELETVYPERDGKPMEYSRFSPASRAP